MNKLWMALSLAFAVGACALPAKTVSYEQALAASETAVVRPASDTVRFDYDAASKRIDKPAANGFYRLVKGQTADGRLVVQDFYVSGKPQTSAFVLAKGEAEDNFVDTRADGSVNFYLPDGSLVRHSVFRDGKEQGSSYYRKNRLYLYTSPSRDGYALLYNTDGGKELEMSALEAAHSHVRFYHDNGRLALEKKGDAPARVWDEKGRRITEHERPYEYTKITMRMHIAARMLSLYAAELDKVFGTASAVAKK